MRPFPGGSVTPGASRYTGVLEGTVAVPAVRYCTKSARVRFWKGDQIASVTELCPTLTPARKLGISSRSRPATNTCETGDFSPGSTRFGEYGEAGSAGLMFVTLPVGPISSDG